MAKFPIVISFDTGAKERRYQIILLNDQMICKRWITQEFDSHQVRNKKEELDALKMLLNQIFENEEHQGMYQPCLDAIKNNNVSLFIVKVNPETQLYELYIDGKRKYPINYPISYLFENIRDTPTYYIDRDEEGMFIISPDGS